MTILELKRLKSEREARECWEEIGRAILGRGKSTQPGVSYQSGMSVNDIIAAAERLHRELSDNNK